ncbi:hypothetical protein JCM8097_003193 [Rhodosporidiobolus ruineniae]
MRLSSLFPLAAVASSFLVLPSSVFAASKPTNLTEAGYTLYNSGTVTFKPKDKKYLDQPVKLSFGCSNMARSFAACHYVDPDGDLACWTGPHNLTYVCADTGCTSEKLLDADERETEAYISIKPGANWTMVLSYYRRRSDLEPGEEVVLPCSPHDRLNSNIWLFYSLKSYLEQIFPSAASFARQQSYLDFLLSTAHNPVFCYLFGFLCGFFVNCNLRPRPPAQSTETRKN